MTDDEINRLMTEHVSFEQTCSGARLTLLIGPSRVQMNVHNGDGYERRLRFAREYLAMRAKVLLG